jgi:arsenate reductase
MIMPTLQETIQRLSSQSLSDERKDVLRPLIEYIQSKLDAKEEIRLNFICTHNSRRSQFAQLWAHAAAHFHNIPAHCFSGGVEVTAFNERAVRTIQSQGFLVEKEGERNPIYQVKVSEDAPALPMFSKLYDDSIHPTTGFAAVMTCSHADENCPFIPGAEKRIPVRYDDPKAFDDTPLEQEKYAERSLEIGAEMWYVFSQLKK